VEKRCTASNETVYAVRIVVAQCESEEREGEREKGEFELVFVFSGRLV
jgi:hypothetical protein